MNSVSKLLILLTLSSVLMISCTSTYAVYSVDEGSLDTLTLKNDVVEYKSPSYKTRKNALYWIGVVAGGTAGYVFGGGTNKTMKPGNPNAALSALGGVLLSSWLFNLPGPKSGTTQITKGQEQKWLDEVNKEMRESAIIVSRFAVPTDNISNIYLVPKQSETNFIMGNLDDAFLFSSAFPNSPKSLILLENSIPNFERNELPELIKLFKNEKAIKLVKLYFLNSGIAVYDYINAYKTYPSLEIEAEKKVAEKASNIAEYKLYLATFPTGASASIIRGKLAEAEK